MLIRESRLREIVRSVLRENGGDPVDLDLTDDLELSEEEVKGALDDLDLTDDLDFTEEDVEAVMAAKQKKRNAKVTARNLELTSQYLLKMKAQDPQKFKEVVAAWVPHVGNQRAGMVQWMKALESGEVQTQLSYSKVDKYQDLSRQFLKNDNWVSFVRWYFEESRNTIDLDPIKVKKKKKKSSTGSGREMAY